MRLRGPADVVGIDAHQIVRMDPRPGSDDFEPNYFPVHRVRSRPTSRGCSRRRAPNANARLRPWLCLVVVRKQDGVTLGSTPDTPLPTLQIAAPAKPAAELPDLRECWAWAHAQAAAADNGAAAVGAALGGAPELSLSRLLCPRLLAPNTDYIACVVPTFELGRKARPGAAGHRRRPHRRECAGAGVVAAPTAPAAGAAAGLLHHWEFRTGVGGDFESLARRLKPQPAPAGLGQRPHRHQHAGLRAARRGCHPARRSASKARWSRSIAPTTAPPAWPSGTQAPFQSALAAIVNAPGQSAVADPQADPLLAPPLYGRWYAARAIVAPGGAAWLDQLNLDPRYACVRRVRHARRPGASGGADGRRRGSRPPNCSRPTSACASCS